MTDLTHDRARGVRAREILENPLVVESLDALKIEYTRAWEQSPARDTDGRERLWVMTKLVDKFKGHLEQIVSDGKLAEAELKRLVEIEKRKKMLGVW